MINIHGADAVDGRDELGFHVPGEVAAIEKAEAAELNVLGIEVADFEALATQIARSFGEIIRDEDYAMSASQQRSADAGALDQIVFGRNEPALHHYHNTYRSMLGQELLPLLDKITADG